MFKKEENRKKRHYRIRKKISGTNENPRLSVRRSNANLHVQLVDDIAAKTLVSASTLTKEIKSECGYGGNVKAAVVLGKYVAGKMKEKGISTLRFDRGGYRYLGRVKAFADSLRENGIKF